MAIPWEVRKVCPNISFMVKSRSKRMQISIQDINNPLHAFVLGTILGDGYITKRGRLQVDQSVLQYTQWKFEVLQSVIPTTTVIAEVKRIHVKTKKENISYRFYTQSVFEQWRQAFYLENLGGTATKILPCNIADLLIHPLSLAVWFSDDGGKGGNTPNGVVISVFKFSDNEVKTLQSCLVNNFDIESTFHAKNSSRQLYIPAKQYIKWKKLVSPFIIPCMRYKLL